MFTYDYEDEGDLYRMKMGSSKQGSKNWLGIPPLLFLPLVAFLLIVALLLFQNWKV